jgi:anaerobic carbon-monoxide dehydrogenase iron sulfur subunit
MQAIKESQITEKKFVAADPEKCIGCGVCELICAVKKEKVYSPRLSRIKILQLYRLVNMSIACKLCENAPCVTACPLGCLVQSEKTGVILVDEDKCDCCGWCMEACPYGAIVLNPEKGTVMICDLCDGEPQCVEWCPEEALDLVTQKEFDANLRQVTVNKLIDETLSSAETSGNEVENEQAKEREVARLLQELSENEGKRESLNLLVEAFSEPKPLDVLIYGMYVKKHLAFMVPGASMEKIEKTLQWLSDAIKLVENSEKR